MASKIPPMGRPNIKVMSEIDDDDIVRAREYYIVKLVSAYRSRDADTLKVAVEWIVALTSEMRLRGTRDQPGLLTI